MFKDLKPTLLIGISLTIISCSSEETLPVLPEQNNSIETKISSTDIKAIDKDFAKAILEALDINKNGTIDVTEAPIIIGEANKDPLAYNFELVAQANSLKNYELISEKTFKPSKAITINMVLDKFLKNKNSVLTIYNGKIAEKNKNKISSNLAKVLLKDDSTEGNRVNTFAKEIGFTTKKAFYAISKLDSSTLNKKILEQFQNENGTEVSIGSLTIYRDTLSINNHNARISFYEYSSFTRDLPKVGSFKFTDPRVTQ